MTYVSSFQRRGSWLRRASAAGALILLAASCGPDALPDVQPAPVEPSPTQASPPSSSAAMPRDLRAAYIAAVQAKAPEAYAARTVRPGSIVAENEAARFVTTMDHAGAVLMSDVEPWSVSMRTAGLGCEGAVAPVSEAEPEAEGNRVSYRHEGLSAWYLNGPLGLEQGFIVDEAPGCAGTKVLMLEVGGELRAELEDADGDGRGEVVRLVDVEGRVALTYADLFVKDAKGKELPAWLSVSAGQIAVHVEDAGAAYPVEIDPLIGIQQAKLLASDGIDGDRFGFSVALSGDTAIVSAYYDDDKGGDSGSAYVFVRSGGAWTQQAKLVASDGAFGDGFGHSVSLSGDAVLIGAPRHASQRGAAYLFARSGGVWTEVMKLAPGDLAVGDNFGCSVALEGDAALVGAQYDDDKGFHAGSAYGFDLLTATHTKILASDGAAGDNFGASVALSGITALIGADQDGDSGSNAGSTYVFLRNGSLWIQKTKLLASDGAASAFFGSSVALSGDTALVGALNAANNGVQSGAAYVFVSDGASWSQQAKLAANDGATADAFGSSVALSGDTALIGAPGQDAKASAAGAAYVFVRNGGAWTQDTKLLASDGMPIDQFGVSVALSGDTALIGADGADVEFTPGWAYVFALLLSNGESCSLASACGSGFCVDGVCCDSACGDGVADCQACSVAAGAAVNGTCGLIAADTVCRAQAGDCDAAEVCDGMSAACPSDMPAAQGTECLPATGECDLAASCDGASPSCPTNPNKPDGTACTGGTCLAGACMDTGAAGSGGGGTGGGGGAGGGGTGGGDTGGNSADNTITAGGGCGCVAAGTTEREGAATWAALGLLGMILARRRRS